MKKLAMVALCAFLAGCNMTPQQRQAWAQGMHNASQLSAQQQASQRSNFVYCQRNSGMNSPVETFQYACPPGYWPVH